MRLILLFPLLCVSFGSYALYQVSPVGFTESGQPFSPGDVFDSSFISNLSYQYISPSSGQSGPMFSRCFVQSSTGLYCRDPQGYLNLSASVFSVSSCPSGQELSDSGICEVPSKPCDDVIGIDTDIGWFSSVHGTTPPSNFWCSTSGGGCGSELKSGTAFCGSTTGNNYDCIATYTITGPECALSDGDDAWCSDSTCQSPVEPKPDPEPEPEPEPDPVVPDHEPSDPTKPLEDPNPLPPVDTTPTPPLDVDGPSDVVEPPLTPESNGDVVKSIANMNRDVNSALNNLNIDINQNSATANTQLAMLNANMRQNSEQVRQLQQSGIDIYQNNKALIQNLNKDVTTAINRNTERVDAELERVGDSVDALGGKLDSIGESLDMINNVDTSNAGVTGTCIQTDTCSGYYESKYPDGLSGLASTQLQSLKADFIDGFVGAFGQIDLSNAQKPEFGLPVPFYGWMYFDDYINMDWIFSFIRTCFILTSVFYSRRIMFGG